MIGETFENVLNNEVLFLHIFLYCLTVNQS